MKLTEISFPALFFSALGLFFGGLLLYLSYFDVRTFLTMLAWIGVLALVALFYVLIYRLGWKRLSSVMAIIIYGFTLTTVLLVVLLRYQIQQANLLRDSIDSLQQTVNEIGGQVQQLSVKIDNYRP